MRHNKSKQIPWMPEIIWIHSKWHLIIIYDIYPTLSLIYYWAINNIIIAVLTTIEFQSEFVTQEYLVQKIMVEAYICKCKWAKHEIYFFFYLPHTSVHGQSVHSTFCSLQHLARPYSFSKYVQKESCLIWNPSMSALIETQYPLPTLSFESESDAPKRAKT